MKQEGNPFQDDSIDEEAYRNDIVSMLMQLNNKDKPLPSQPPATTPSRTGTGRGDNPPISEESDFCSTSLRQFPSPKPKKTHKIDKNTRHHNRSDNRKAPTGQKSLEMFAINSAPDGGGAEKQSPPKPTETSGSRLKGRELKLKEKEEQLSAMTEEYYNL